MLFKLFICHIKVHRLHHGNVATPRVWRQLFRDVTVRLLHSTVL